MKYKETAIAVVEQTTLIRNARIALTSLTLVMEIFL
jgi:hypothetical protein